MTDYHEPPESLSPATRDAHRALTSLKEEIEAVDWYHQRVETCGDSELVRVLAHNRDEEIEHACMTLEWLRRNMPGWHAQLQKYLFSTSGIVHEEKAQHDAEEEGTSEDGGSADRAAADDTAVRRGRGLGIGSLRERNQS